MKKKRRVLKERPPASLRPLLWWAPWEKIETKKDKEDIIVSAVNEGTLAHWRWLIETYGKPAIRKVLQRRLASEFHPESRNLAKVIFSIPSFRHARKSPY